MSNFAAWGINESYRDDYGQWRDVSQETKTKFLVAMDATEDRPPESPVIVVRQSMEQSLPAACKIILEDGTDLPEATTLAPDLPLGYHTIFEADGREKRLIVAPGKCFLPPDLHTWGWAVQLYALRSQASWGMGDLEDLRNISNWASDLGAGVVMVNPLCATTPVLPQQASPYYPSSRLYLNPLYLRIEKIAGAGAALAGISTMSDKARVLNDQALIDRNAIFQLKMSALELLWSRVRENVDFREFERARGPSLDLFAAFCVLAEQHGCNWRAWPFELRRPDGAGIAGMKKQFADRLRFHKWVQFLLDEQLKAAAETGNLMQDLPVGVDPDGADAWMWQDTFAKNVSVGAPPDLFNANGQDWGLPPFVPHKLRAAGYEPFIETIRAALRYARGLRIDHVMGLFRLFWIPVGEPSAHGAYVRYNADEMLAILALESSRSKTFVVGEDLGTVDDGVREKLADHAVLSYRLLWFEENLPEQYPRLALAAVTTHDLPTIAGIWTGADFDEQAELGLQPKEENAAKIRQSLKRATHVNDGANLSEVIVKTHEALARSPAVITMASLEDGLAAERRPNLPGANNEQRANWCIPLSKKLEDIQSDEITLKIAQCLNR